jgi:tetratricopeptide (TPR) repeat protein
MDQVRVLRIVVASPGDVKPERDTVPKVVDEVNRTIARERGLHLNVDRWETDSHPGFHPQGPQGLIDPQLRIEDCDLLIGIFWRRFGKPVSNAKSGTEHEFRIAYETWQKKRKPQIMMYFSQKKYFAQSTEETVQAGLVLQFKKDFPPEGLWWDYKNKSEFAEFLRNHLTQFLQEQSPIESKSGKTQPETLPLTALHQLPPPPADFTGRTTELAKLRAAIEKGGIHIFGLQGQGGVGKTALALKLAAELTPNYPDAQIYLDLKGVSEKPLTAAEAMSHALRTFHPEAKLPKKGEDLRALYLSVLHNKRALLLMDNAKDAAQMESLIPPPICALLVTARSRFHLPGLQPTHLDSLPPQDAKDLLLEIAPRIDGEADAIARLCGYLPLALRLAAMAIAERIDLAPTDYRQRLADEKQRLKLLGGDKGVSASITLSYNLLDAEAQKRWRILSVFPDTFDAPAAAAVWETDENAAKQTLGDLKQLSMLEWNDATKRYRLHDLMHAFARQRLTDAESGDTARRHATYYGTLLSTADDLYLKGGESIIRGLALFDLEWGNIRAGQAWAVACATQNSEAAKLCSDYSQVGWYCLELRQPARERIGVLEVALVAARSLQNRDREGWHLGQMGIAHHSLGDYRRAVECHEQHLAIAREIGDRQAEGAALCNLGLAYHSLGDYRRSIEYYEQDLSVARGIADRRGEGSALGNLGSAYYRLGDYPRAIEYYERRLTIAREIGDRLGEGDGLSGMGVTCNSLGEYGRAVEYHEQHLTIARAIRDRQGEGNALCNMSSALDKLGNRKKAIEHAEAALKICEQIEAPNAEMVRKQLDIWRNS